MNKNIFKKITAIVLAVAMAVSVCNTGAGSAEAKSSVPTIKSVEYLIPEYNLYNMDNESYSIKVEVGNKFYLGDLITGSVLYSNGAYGSRYLTGLNVKYKSSNTKVCTVEKSGLVNPIKKGSSKITVKLKGQSVVVTVNVVKKGALKHIKKADNTEKKIKKYSKSFKGVFDESNAKKMISAAKKCKNLIEPYYFEDYTKERYAAEFGFTASKADDEEYYSMTNELINPWNAHYHAMDSIIYGEFYVKYDPFVRSSINPAYIKSAKAVDGSSDAVITLSRKITALEYTMLSYCGGSLVNGKPLLYCYVTSDSDPGYYVYADGLVKKNSDKVTLTLKYGYDKSSNMYWPEDTSANSATMATAKKITTFTSKKSYNFYTEFGSDDKGNFVYADADKSWTNNYKLTVE